MAGTLRPNIGERIILTNQLVGENAKKLGREIIKSLRVALLPTPNIKGIKRLQKKVKTQQQNAAKIAFLQINFFSNSMLLFYHFSAKILNYPKNQKPEKESRAKND